MPGQPRGLGATRSSDSWAKMPGNCDRLNTRALFEGDPEWGIPLLPPAAARPSLLVPYHDRHQCDRAGEGAAVHFFLEDRHFETAWSQPERSLSRLRRVGLALTPDFSLYRDMPLAMQLWQVYRNRWCGAWWLSRGIQVIPTVAWSGPESYPFAFTGIAAGSHVAVSTVGVMRDPEARRLFAAGYDAMLEHVRPPLVLYYGKLPAGLPAEPPVVTYPARWSRSADAEAPGTPEAAGPPSQPTTG